MKIKWIKVDKDSLSIDDLKDKADCCIDAYEDDKELMQYTIDVAIKAKNSKKGLIAFQMYNFYFFFVGTETEAMNKIMSRKSGV